RKLASDALQCPRGVLVACAKSRREVTFAPLVIPNGVPKAPPGSAAPAVARAGVAQSAEHLFCKQVVRGSSPLASSCRSRIAERPVTKFKQFGGLPEWPKGADCKSAGYAFDGS